MDECYKELDTSVRSSESYDFKSILKFENENVDPDQIHLWEDEEFLAPIRTNLEQFENLMSDFLRNQINIRDSLIRLHEIFQHFILPECDVLVASGLIHFIIEILDHACYVASDSSQNNRLDVTIISLYIAADLTRGDEIYMDMLLQNGFLNTIIQILNADKRLTLAAKSQNTLNKYVNLSEPVLVCLNNIVLSPKFNKAINIEHLFAIAQKIDTTKTDLSEFYIARFFAFYTRNFQITNNQLQVKIIHCCRVLIGDQVDKIKSTNISNDSNSSLNNGSKKFIDLVRYTGQILYYLINQQSCDLSIFDKTDEYPSILEEWIHIAFKFKLKEPIIFLSRLVYLDSPLLNSIPMNLNKFLKRTLQPSNTNAMIYIEFFANYIDKRPDIINELPDLSKIINELLPEWSEKTYSEKASLIPFVCNFILHASIEKMKDLEYVSVMALLEETIDSSIDDDIFIKILQTLLKFHSFANEIQLNDADIMPIFQTIVSNTLDILNDVNHEMSENEIINVFIRTFSESE